VKRNLWDWEIQMTQNMHQTLHTGYAPVWASSRAGFLVYKHLVQVVHPVPPHFFQQASQKHTTLFWEHPDLHILSKGLPSSNKEQVHAEVEGFSNNSGNEEDVKYNNELDEEDCKNALTSKTFDESLDHWIVMMQDFIGALEYQQQFQDSHFFTQLDQWGASLCQFIVECQGLECHTNLTHRPTPNTRERNGSTMFYCTRRCCPKDHNTWNFTWRYWQSEVQQPQCLSYFCNILYLYLILTIYSTCEGVDGTWRASNIDVGLTYSIYLIRFGGSVGIFSSSHWVK